MTKQTKEKEPKREAGPKFRQVIPEDFRIRKTESPMARILREAEESVSSVDALSNMDSPPDVDRLSTEQPPAGPVDSPPVLSSLPTPDSLSKTDTPDLLSLVPRVAGHSQLPHTYTDHICHWLSADEQAVYVQLYRLSWGWNKPTCFISNRRLSERSGVPLTSMRRAVGKLVLKRLIEKTNRVFGSNAEQGIEYRVFGLSNTDSPSTKDSLSKSAPNKEKLYKETNSKSVDASQCPDCYGTGMYYPDGYDKGVARCPHSKLPKTS
jgi:hypothetical protein